MNVFLERVKQLQASQNITQKEMSDMTDISINTIRGWFSKDVNPDVFYAVKIAKALNTTVEYLVTGIEPEITKQDVLNYLQNNLS